MPRRSESFELVRAEVLANIASLDQVARDKLALELRFRLSNSDESIDFRFFENVLHILENDGQAETRGGQLSVDEPQTSAISTRESVKQISPREQDLLRQIAERGFEEDEEHMDSNGQEFDRPHQTKYPAGTGFSPRVPHFLNRIKMGVVWNKYAQTHYDEANPPPKQVLGYRFNILYPDLFDKSIAPSYKLQPSSVPGTLVLRFIAGAPYEDIAFRIVNKEWDLDRRSGFQCLFENGVLQLNFVFKRDRYRR